MIRLFYWRLFLLWRSLTYSKRQIFSYGLLTFIGIIWFVFAFRWSRGLFGNLRQGIPELSALGVDFFALELTLLVVIFLIGFALSLFTATGSAFTVMYSSSDLTLFFTAPLTVRQVFIVKFSEIMATVFFSVVLTTVPGLLGYGVGMAAGWQFYLGTVFLAMSTIVAATALGTLLNLVVMRFVPAYRVRELGVALSSLFGAVIYVLVQWGTRRMLVVRPEQWVGLVSRFSLLKAGISPVWWLAQATLALVKGQISQFVSWFGLVIVLAVVLFTLAFYLVQEAFYGGWAGSSEARNRTRKGKRKNILSQAFFSWGAGSPVVAVAVKEVHTITRDMREWAQAIYMIVVVGAAFVIPNVGSGQSPLSESASLYLALGCSFFLSFMLASSLALGAVAREGKSWSLLRSTPLAVEQILWGKLLGIASLVAGTALALVMLYMLFFGQVRYLFHQIMLLCLIVPALVAVNIAAGTIEPNFNASDQRKRVSGWATVTSLLLGAVYAIIVAAGIAMMVSGAWSGRRAILRLLGLLLLLGSSIGAVVIPISFASRACKDEDGLF